VGQLKHTYRLHLLLPSLLCCVCCVVLRCAPLAPCVQVAKHTLAVEKKLLKAEEQARQFNSRENLFHQDITDYVQLANIRKTFDPYYSLWTTASFWLRSSHVLCCAVLCCAVLCCVVLCCVVLRCAVLCWAVLCCSVLCCAVLSCVFPHESSRHTGGGAGRRTSGSTAPW
jgi:hypothetical protein